MRALAILLASALPALAGPADDAADCAVLYRANWEFEKATFDAVDVSDAWKGMSESYWAVAVRKGLAHGAIKIRMRDELAAMTEKVTLYTVGEDAKLVREIDKAFDVCVRILDSEPEMAEWR